MSLGTMERRLGERKAVHGIVVDWNTRGRRIQRRRIRSSDAADIIDISVSGAQFLAKSSKKLQPGQLITIAAGGSLGKVLIKRISNLSSSKLCTYGVEFVDLEEPLEAFLFEYAKTNIPESVQVVWRKDSVSRS